MGLIWDRIKRLIAANVRELIEAAKDPEVELLEYAAEVEGSYGEIKAELVDASNAASQIERQLQETQKEIERWNDKAKAALQQSDEEIAREALKRKARFEALASHMRLQLEEQLELGESLKNTLDDLRSKLHETQKQKDVLLARSSRAAASKRVTDVLKSKAWWTGDSVTERLSQEILDRKSRMEAYQELHNSTLEAELSRLTPQRTVEEEVDKLKRELNKDKQS